MTSLPDTSAPGAAPVLHPDDDPAAHPELPPKKHYKLHGDTPRIVILGCGFAGLNFVKSFKGDAEIVIIDKQNHHLFQPLLYQVAMSALAVPEIAEPIRSIVRKKKNVVTVMEEVESIDLEGKHIELRESSVDYTHLIIAMGGKVTYFGNDHWEQFAPGLKTIDDALRIRRRVLTSLERAETEADADERRRLMTIVVIGGGPTGTELAGTMAELCRNVFTRDFRNIDTNTARVVLVDAGPRVLPTYPEDLSASALRQLEGLGVQVLLNTMVKDIDDTGVTFASGERIEARNILWGGGVNAHPITQTLGVELARGGRVVVNPDLSIPGHPEAFAVGDIAWSMQDNDQPVPGVAPAAMQMGKHVGKVLKQEIATGKPLPPEQRKAFKYWDKGEMATIGRNKAVAWPFKKVKFSGFFAWLAWALVHVLFLIGFRNRVVVIIRWFTSYLFMRPGARIIFTGMHRPLRSPCPTAAESKAQRFPDHVAEPTPPPEPAAA
ncbi:MAG: NAD(P)/FAD-dependent oxidoreductase [Planctomycetota bacterium]